jgi:hypothetical protein
MIAGHAGISTAAARQALLAHEKADTATRVKGSRTGIPDAWTLVVLAAPPRRGPARRDPLRGQHRGHRQPSAEPANGTADVGQPAPAPAESGEAEAATAPGPDPAVTAEAAGNVLAIAQAADGSAGPSRRGTWTRPSLPCTPRRSRPPRGGG